MDLDGDGKLEILSGSLPGEIYCFHRKPNGSYGPGEVLKDTTGKPINVGRASAVAVADWNGDGKPDLIIGNIDGGVFLVLNEGTAQKPAWAAPNRSRPADAILWPRGPGRGHSWRTGTETENWT